MQSLKHTPCAKRKLPCKDTAKRQLSGPQILSGVSRLVTEISTQHFRKIAMLFLRKCYTSLKNIDHPNHFKPSYNFETKWDTAKSFDQIARSLEDLPILCISDVSLAVSKLRWLEKFKRSILRLIIQVCPLIRMLGKVPSVKKQLILIFVVESESCI